MAEAGEPIEQPAVYRLGLFALIVWAAHFSVAYAAILIFPGHAIARWIAIAALVAAVAALAWRVRRMGKPRPPLALAAVGLSLAAIVFGTFPALVG